MGKGIIITLGLLIPLIGTTLGSGMVFFVKKNLNPLVNKFLLGFAGGVMVAASVWSLLIPSIDMAGGSFAWIPAFTGFLLGVAFLLVLDELIPHLHINDDKPEGLKAHLKKSVMLVLAVTLHNIPEGMAVGVVFAGLYSGQEIITLSGALALSTGIAIQNFPEGAIISLPLSQSGVSKIKTFFYGFVSGVVEPISALITILLASLILPLLPYFLSFAAGAMIYVVVEELIPEAQEGPHSNACVIGFSIGFALMMILDVALG